METITPNSVLSQVEDKGLITIMESSGCGRSTLLDVLRLLDNPTDGRYWLGDKEASALKEEDCTGVRRGEMGFVFQSFSLIDEPNVEENIELPLTYLGMSKTEREREVKDITKRMGTNHHAKHSPYQLSGGQQQHVAITRAMVSGPKPIFASEPVGNPDSKNGAKVMSLLAKLSREGTTIVVVTRNERDISIAHRIVRPFDGQIVGWFRSKA